MVQWGNTIKTTLLTVVVIALKSRSPKAVNISL